MTMNRLIPIIGALVLLIAVVVVIKSGQRKPEPAMLGELPTAPKPDADTPADTVRSLSAQVAELVDQTKQLTEENQRLREQNANLRQNEDRIVNKVQAKVADDLSRKGQQDNRALSSLQAEIDRLRNRLTEVGTQAMNLPKPTSGPSQGGDMPIGFGLEGATGAVHWIEPIDAVPGAAKAPEIAANGAAGSSLLWPGGKPQSVTAGQPQGVLEKVAHRAASRVEAAAEIEPVYTLPANATLIGSTAFSALVGRVPVGGQVQDPMPIKVLVGADNLAANGHHIPGLEGMVLSGYAIGDWTLSCVRGKLTSATFVFEDGHVLTFGERKPGQGGKDKEEAIGWISDKFGVPCISGKKITNAPAFLSQRVGLTALGAAAEAAAASQTTTSTALDGAVASSSVTGKKGPYVLGKTVSSGTQEITNWLDQRMANSFDAIFAPAGTEVEVHLDVTLPIDYDPAGRMLDHRTARAGQGGPYGYLD